MTSTTSYTNTTTTTLDFDDAVAHAIEQLGEQGFGVLADIDVQATLKRKLDVDREPYRILGACNPSLAHRALEAEPELGALLPCNVVVRVEDGVTHVSSIDAAAMLGIVGRDELLPIAGEVNERLASVLATFPR